MRVKTGVLASFAAHATTVGLSIVAVPLFLRAFGTEVYGFWAALLGLTAYLALLNLGVAQTVSARVATADRGDVGSIVRSVRKGIRIYGRVIAIAVPPIAAACWWIPWAALFGLPQEYERGLSFAALAVAVTSLLELPFSVLRSALRALGHVATERMYVIAVSVLRFAVACVCALTRPPLWIAVVALSAANVLGHLACGAALARTLPGLLRPQAPGELDAGDQGRFGTASLHFFLMQIAGAVVWSTDPVFAGVMLGATEAAQIAIAWRVLWIAFTFGALVGLSLGPFLAQAWARGDVGRATGLATDAAQLVFGVALLVVLASLAGGRVLFALWVGEELFLGFGPWALYCAVVLINGMLTIPASFLNHAGRHLMYARGTVVEATVKAVSTVVLVPLLGLYGLPLATLIGQFSTTLWLLPAEFARTMPVDLRSWLWSVARPALLASPGFAGVWIVGRALAATDNPWWEAGVVGLASAAYLLVFVRFGIPADLRRRAFSGLDGFRRSPGESRG